MAFALFQIYIVALLVRPIELFQLELGNLRPMLVLYALAVVAAILQAGMRRKIAARPVHYMLLIGFTLTIAASMLVNGWPGGALVAVQEFAPAAGLFVLASLNLTSTPRIKASCFLFMLCLLLNASLAIFAYHTGNLADQLVMRQSTHLINFQEVPDHLKDLPPESLQNLPYTERSKREEELRAAELKQDPNKPRRAEMPQIIPAEEKSGFFLWRVRGLGFFNDPNDLAQAMVLVLPFLWLFHKRGAALRNLSLVWLPAAVFLYAIILTNSRGALVGLAALIFFGARSILGTTKAVIALAGLVAIVLVGLVGGSRGFSSSSDESAGDRIDLWYVGINLVKSQPILGVGFGNFTEHAWLTAHNSFVLCFAELGLSGFFFWVAMLTIAFQGLNQITRLAATDSTEYQMATLLRASLTGFLVCGFFLSRTYQGTLFLMLGTAVACWYCWQLKASNEGKSLPPVRWLTQTVTMMIASMALIYSFIKIDSAL